MSIKDNINNELLKVIKAKEPRGAEKETEYFKKLYGDMSEDDYIMHMQNAIISYNYIPNLSLKERSFFVDGFTTAMQLEQDLDEDSSYFDGIDINYRLHYLTKATENLEINEEARKSFNYGLSYFIALSAFEQLKNKDEKKGRKMH